MRWQRMIPVPFALLLLLGSGQAAVRPASHAEGSSGAGTARALPKTLRAGAKTRAPRHMTVRPVPQRRVLVKTVRVHAAAFHPKRVQSAAAAPLAGLDARSREEAKLLLPKLPEAGAYAGGGMGVTIGGAAPRSLQVMVDRSLLIHTETRLKRIAVSDPKVVQATVVSPTQVLLHGRAPGEASLMLWDQQEQSRSYVLRVNLDAGAAEAALQRLFPGSTIHVSASGRVLVLSGHVDTPAIEKEAVKIAAGFAPDVVSTMQTGPLGPQEVLLEVKFAEVDRTALTQLGVNIFSTGAANTIGATTTGQFGGFSGSNVGSSSNGTQAGGGGGNVVSGAIGSRLAGQAASFATGDLLNVFLFRSDINLGVLIKALQQKNLLQILAEPNLVAVSGKSASFLAGGEFPFPVVQSGTGYNAVTIEFKPFGVRLNFTPQILPDGNIFLHVAPEVSALDFTNAVTMNGFVVPALSTRRADTSFELRDGQSFVIAGLMDNRLTKLASKIPGLGDIPVLGQLFRSKNLQKSNTELMVLVTAIRVSPGSGTPGLPRFPSPFLSPQQFDAAPRTAPRTPGGRK